MIRKKWGTFGEHLHCSPCPKI